MLTGFRTLLCGIALLILNDPGVHAFVLAHTSGIVAALMNLVLSGAGLAFLNAKLNEMKSNPPPAPPSPLAPAIKD